MPRAASLAAYVEEKRGMPVDLRPGDRGAFEVLVDGRVVFSKLREGRFPEPDEVLRLLEKGP